MRLAVDHLKALTHHRHAGLRSTANALALAAEVSPAAAQPVRQRAIAVALAGGKFSDDLVKGHDVHPLCVAITHSGFWAELGTTLQSPDLDRGLPAPANDQTRAAVARLRQASPLAAGLHQGDRHRGGQRIGAGLVVVKLESFVEPGPGSAPGVSAVLAPAPDHTAVCPGNCRVTGCELDKPPSTAIAWPFT